MTDSSKSLIEKLEAFWKKEEAVYQKAGSSYNEGFVDGIDECIQIAKGTHPSEISDNKTMTIGSVPCPICCNITMNHDHINFGKVPEQPVACKSDMHIVTKINEIEGEKP